MNGLSGVTSTLGTITFLCNTSSFNFRQTFHVLSDADTTLHCDGILGTDFLTAHQAQICFGSRSMTVTSGNKQVHLPLVAGTSPPVCTVEALHEQIVYFHVENDSDVFIPAHDIQPGVFVANVITRPVKGYAPCLVVNTTSSAVNICDYSPPTEDLSSYDAVNAHQDTTPRSAARTALLLQELKFPQSRTEQQQAVLDLCCEFSDIFHLPGDQLSTTNLGTQRIHLKPDAVPRYIKPYRIPHAHREEVDRQVKEMYDQGLIEPSLSPFNSPIILVPRKGNKRPRTVIDYRHLNTQICDDKFPLPNITDILDGLGKARVFSTLDLSQSYYQLALHESSRPCTAFTTADNHWQMTRLPMGLKISGSAYSRIMSLAMSGLTPDRCFTYLDDLICFGSSMAQHNQNLRKIFERLRAVRLKLNGGKCSFLQDSVLYCGVIISGNGISPDPAKFEVTRNYPRPENPDDVIRFIAFVNFYRRFIPHFNELSHPISRLVKKNAVWNWTPECEKSFLSLKDALCTAPVLEFPDFSTPFIVHTDASKIAISGILSNSNGHPVAYASRPLKDSETRWDPIHLELLAISWIVTKAFRVYLQNRHFTLRTDCRSLRSLYNLKATSSRLTKLRLSLEEFDFNIEWIAGSMNGAADALSRVCTLADLKASANAEEADPSVSTDQARKPQLFVITRQQARAMQRTDLVNNHSAVTLNQIDPPTRPDQPTVVDVLRAPPGFPEIRFFDMNEDIEKSMHTENTKNRSKNTKTNKKSTPPRNSRSENCCVKLKKCLYCLETNLLWVPLINAHNEADPCLGTLPSLLAEIRDDVHNISTKLKVKEFVVLKNELMKLNDNMTLARAILQEFVPQASNADAAETSARYDTTQVKFLIVSQALRIDNETHKRLILEEAHSAPSGGHAGMTRMQKSIQLRYFWPNMKKDIVDYVSRCVICKKSKHSFLPKEPLQITTTASRPFQKLYLDLVGPLLTTSSGDKYLLTVQCELTKFVEAFPLPSKEASVVSRVLVEEFFLRYGIAENCASDLGSEFINAILIDVCKILQINKMHSTAYHHESIGALENSHKSLGNYLRAYSFGNQWDEWIRYFVFSYNTTVHSSHGYTPHELVYGFLCRLPSKLTMQPRDNVIYNLDDYALELRYRLQFALSEARKNLIDCKTKRKRDLDAKRKERNVEINQKVLLRNESGTKLCDLFEGPYTVIDVSPPNCTLKIRNKPYTVHLDRVRPL